MARFKNPMNGYELSGGTMLSWLWALIFGPFYLMAKGCWGWAAGWIAAIFAAVGIFGIFALPAILAIQIGFALAASAIIDGHYGRAGWIELDLRTAGADLPAWMEWAPVLLLVVFADWRRRLRRLDRRTLQADRRSAGLACRERTGSNGKQKPKMIM